MDKGLFDYQASVEQVIKSYSTSLLNGLTNEEVEIRKKAQGLNKIAFCFLISSSIYRAVEIEKWFHQTGFK